eukprot:snap_masked-scaffold443_size169656-processed-gene-0.6 protein:Tk07431 transcript:snap_masked-scaffold443_size169656-processed-gene-0.6-mRNA-1 annotation:"PREDICTED: papilin-like"
MERKDAKLVPQVIMDQPGIRYVPASQGMSSQRKTRMASTRFALIVSTLALAVSVGIFAVLCLWVYGLPGQIEDQSAKIHDLTALLEFQQSELEALKNEKEVRNSNANPCALPPAIGPCMAAMPRWYFNPHKQKCEQFAYGGCQGNGNNFVTLGRCQSQCGGNNQNLEIIPIQSEGAQKGAGPKLAQKQPAQVIVSSGEVVTSEEGSEDPCQMSPSAGPCKSQMPRFYFDALDQECKKFLYGGCAGNANNFVTQDQCSERCAQQSRTAERPGQPPSTGHDCQSPPEVGLCRAIVERWFHDPQSGECQIFSWGGCGGNDNNFSSQDKCEKVCGAERKAALSGPEAICSQPKKVGPCRAGMPRFHFNSQTKACEMFDFGGCDANENNFESLELCEAMCVQAESQPQWEEEGPDGNAIEA